MLACIMLIKLNILKEQVIQILEDLDIMVDLNNQANLYNQKQVQSCLIILTYKNIINIKYYLSKTIK